MSASIFSISCTDGPYLSTCQETGEQNSFASASRRRRKPSSTELPGLRYFTNCSSIQSLSFHRLGELQTRVIDSKFAATVKLGAQIVCKAIESASLIIVHLCPGRNFLQFRAANPVDFPRQAFFSPFRGNSVALLNFAAVRIFGRAPCNALPGTLCSVKQTVNLREIGRSIGERVGGWTSVAQMATVSSRKRPCYLSPKLLRGRKDSRFS